VRVRVWKKKLSDPLLILKSSAGLAWNFSAIIWLTWDVEKTVSAEGPLRLVRKDRV
jgi:hypothetical protein